MIKTDEYCVICSTIWFHRFGSNSPVTELCEKLLLKGTTTKQDFGGASKFSINSQVTIIHKATHSQRIPLCLPMHLVSRALTIHYYCSCKASKQLDQWYFFYFFLFKISQQVLYFDLFSPSYLHNDQQLNNYIDI